MSVGSNAPSDKQQVADGLFAPNQNEILAQLSATDLTVITAGADEVELDIRHEVFDRGDSLRTVYFPLTGLISMVIVLKNGPIVEAHTVGKEGFVGTPLLNDVATTRCRGVCQVAGRFLALPAADFTERLKSLPDLNRRLRRYSQFATDVLAQNAACSGIHTIEQRCARWLLITADGIGSNDFRLTQEFLSQMLAVRRPGGKRGNALPRAPRAGLALLWAHEDPGSTGPHHRLLRVLRDDSRARQGSSQLTRR